MTNEPFFTLSDKRAAGAEELIRPGTWQRLPFDLSTWLVAGYAILTVQLYALSWGDFDGPTDIRTRLVRVKEATAPDYTAECVHPVADDWAIDHATMMYVRPDTPVYVDIRVMQASLKLHTLIYRGVSLLEYGKGAGVAKRDEEWERALRNGEAWPSAA